MDETSFPSRSTVIFFLDTRPPANILLLERSASKSFAPLWYTGIGGKLEPGEAPITCAYRELEEETGLTGLTLHPFAKAFLNNERAIYYFWSVLSPDQTPDCNEGNLEWVAAEKVLDKKIIPSTKLVVAEWQRRGFAHPEKPWVLQAQATYDSAGVPATVTTSSILG